MVADLELLDGGAGLHDRADDFVTHDIPAALLVAAVRVEVGACGGG